MLERPNICYIFEKLGVQGCQIWHSHVSIPFNSAPAHSTRPHNAKKALYVIISKFLKIGFTKVHWKRCDGNCYQFQAVPGAYLGQKVPPLTPKKYPTMAEYGQKMRCGKLLTHPDPKLKNNCSLFSSTFHLDRPVSRYGRLKLKFLCELFFYSFVQLN